MAAFSSGFSRMPRGIWFETTECVPWFEGFEDLLPTKRFLGLDALGALVGCGCEDILNITYSRASCSAASRHSVTPKRKLWPVFRSGVTCRHYTYVLGSSPYLTLYNLLASVNMDDFEPRCVMRGSCGKKGLFGKPLPCPYNGPPQQVSITECYART
jgi:hypothetical protein